MTRMVKLPGNQIEVRADIGPGRIVEAVLTIDDGVEHSTAGTTASADTPLDQWEKELFELYALAPINPHPVDDSREAIYGPDPGESEPS